MAEKHLLSKSTFIRSVQCLKSLYLYKNFYHLRDPIPKERQAVFNRGIEVGLLAHRLFPGGVDVSPESPGKYSEAVAKTKELIENRAEVIYEAAFVFEQVLAAIDILVKKDGKWYAYEVKSSVKITSTYVMDACLQYYVIKNALPELEDIFIVNVNPAYVLEDELNPQQFFRFTSVKDDAIKNLPFIEDRIHKAKETLANSAFPERAVGEHCFFPYDCDYLGTCWKQIPQGSVFELTNISKAKQSEWYLAGYKKITELPDSIDANESVKKQVEAVKTGKEIIDKEKLRQFFQQFNYPLCYLDVEMMMPAVPVFKGTQPFQQLPFLFSVHVQESGHAPPVHRTFLAESGEDPRKAFAEHLLEALKGSATVLVFADQMERSAIGRLAQHFPELKKELNAVLGKMIDLAVPFQHSWYYNAAMKGSMSLKNIFPALCNDSTFEGLPVNSGVQAMYAFQDLVNEKDLVKIAEVKEQLIEYCKTDTFSMYRIVEELKNKINS